MADRNLLAVTNVEIKIDNIDDFNLLRALDRLHESPSYKAIEAILKGETV